MPPKTRSAQSRATTRPKKGSIRFETPTKESTSSARKWRTSGRVDKQSTLTQIDFVRRPGQELLDSDLKLEEDTTLVELEDSQPHRKRRKYEVTQESGCIPTAWSPGRKDRTFRPFQDEKENSNTTRKQEDHKFAQAEPFTPRKLRRQEIPSSQSPSTPLSHKTPQRQRQASVSPLKAVSANIRRNPRLVVKDTYETNETLSSSPSSVSSHAQLRIETASISRTQAEAAALKIRSQQIGGQEIQDSDGEISEADLIEPSPPRNESSNLNDTTLLDVDLPSQLKESETEQMPALTEAEIMKPPISDSSNSSQSQHELGAIPRKEASRNETSTLEDTSVTRPKRTYSARNHSIKEEFPTSSSLIELPQHDMLPEISKANAEEMNLISSSPPLQRSKQPVSAPRLSAPTSNLERDQLQWPSSPARPALHSEGTDSQQATAQLQQESQWHPSILPPSQATTASIQSSPIKQEFQVTQSGLTGRGWFFNPLTDSQLLPNSIMNFELPRIFGGNAFRAEDELEEEL